MTILLFSGACLAFEDNAGAHVVEVPADKVINRDYYAAGDVVDIAGTVNGDVYAAAGQVIVNGKINGDLLAAGGTVHIKGEVADNVRAAGGHIIVSGNVGRNVSAAGGDVEVTGTGSVKGGVAAVAGSVGLYGPVGYAKVAGGDLKVMGRVKGDLQAAVKNLSLGPGSEVAGNLNYWSSNEARIDDTAVVRGTTSKRAPPYGAERAKFKEFLGGLFFFIKVISAVSILIAGLILINLFPDFNAAAVTNLRERPLSALGLGVAFLILIPFAMVFLFMTVIGIPLAFIMMAFYFVSLYLAKVFVIFAAGAAVLGVFGKRHKNLAYIAGLVIYLVITAIPVLGWLAAFAVLVFGLGAMLLAEKDAYGVARRA